MPSFRRRHWFATLLVHSLILQSLIVLLRVGTTYQAVAIGLDAFWIGVIGSAFGILPALLGMHVGRSIGRHGETLALRTGSFFVLAAFAMCLTAGHSLFTLMISNALLGLGQFLCLTSHHSMVARMRPESRRAVNFGHLTVSISLAQAIGPLVVGLIGGNALVPDTEAMFLSGTIATIVLMGAGWLVAVPAHSPSMDQRSLVETARYLVGIPGYLMAAIASVVLFSAMDLLVIYMPLYGTENGISARTVGMLLAVRAGASVVSRLIFGWLLDHFSRGNLLIAATLISGSSIAVMLLFDNTIFLVIFMAITGFGLGIGGPLTLAWISDIVPAELRASGLALRLSANRVGQSLLPIAVGGVVLGIGASGVLLVLSATLILTSLFSARRLGILRR